MSYERFLFTVITIIKPNSSPEKYKSYSLALAPTYKCVYVLPRLNTTDLCVSQFALLWSFSIAQL